MKQAISPVSIAIIGAGRMGTLYGTIANELALTRLVALCSEHADTTAAAAAKLDVPGYDACRYAEMLDRHPDIEAVVVATPEWAHLDPVLTSLRTGRHVLVEKPFAITPGDAWNMAGEAQKHNRLLTICHSLRFNPRYALMQEAVASGQIGEVIHIYARRNSLQPAVDRVLGKCPLAYWLAPHDIDMILWTVPSPAASVLAHSRSGGNTRDDFIIANIRFENGALAVLEQSWCTPGSAGQALNSMFTVRGSAGMVEVLNNEDVLAVYTAADTVSYPDTLYMPFIHGQTEGGYRSLLRHFVGAVRSLWKPFITAEEGARVIDVAHAIERSLETGTEVAVSRGQAA